MITYLLGGILGSFLALLAYGGLTGRIPLKDGCCCPADPDRDLRMRTDDEEGSTGPDFA